MLGLAGVVLYLVVTGSDNSIFYLVFTYVVIYALTLIIGYGLLRKLNLLLDLGKFAANIVLAIAGNILINFLLFQLCFENPLFLIPVVVLIVLLNFALSKGIFEVNNREARLIGMLAGLLSVPLSITIGLVMFAMFE